MAKFIDKNGKPLSEEELMEASGGVEINPEHQRARSKQRLLEIRTH